MFKSKCATVVGESHKDFISLRQVKGTFSIINFAIVKDEYILQPTTFKEEGKYKKFVPEQMSHVMYFEIHY